MSFNPAVRTEVEWANEDRRWLAHRKGYDSNRSITLDISSFQAAHMTVKGAIPSGVVLGRITASGKYGPYDTDGTDGREVARGFLFSAVVPDNLTLATSTDPGAALTWEGIVNQDFLPVFVVTGNEGKLDAAARADLIHFRFEGTDL
jgi:hypothetical protein